jgi:hypothetical protein
MDNFDYIHIWSACNPVQARGFEAGCLSIFCNRSFDADVLS